MSDEERLRNAMIYGTSHPEIYKTAQEEEIERLRAENKKLREVLIGLYKPVFENPVEVGSALDLALRAAAAAIRESGE